MGNRFNSNLTETYGKELLKFTYNGDIFKIRATEHCLERLKERDIDINISLGDIISLGKEKLYKMADNGDDICIINVQKSISTIITFESDDKNGIQIRIMTIINRSNVWVKNGTKIINLKNYKGGFLKC